MISFHEAQSAIALDNHRFRVVNCGRRFGKTTLAVWEMLGAAVAGDNRHITYIAPTFQQARDIAWLELRRITAPIAKKINESRLEVEVKTTTGGTSLISLTGWESVETLRGQKFHMLVIDEVASMRNFFEGWQEVLRPALTDYQGSTIFISTPKGFNHFYDLYRMEAKDSDYKSFHFTSYDNPHIPSEEIDKARLEVTEDRFAQEYMADFRKTEGLVYKEFDRNKHVIGDSQLPPHFTEKIGGVDFGFTNPAAVLSIGKDFDNRYFVYEEHYKRGQTDAAIAEYVSALKLSRVYPDPENPAAIEELRKRNVNVREVKKGKSSVVNGINVVRELFKSNRLYIHSSCVNTIMELETYAYPDKRDQRNDDENPIKDNDHACFISSTLIKTIKGEKKISEVVVGDIVLTNKGERMVLTSELTKKEAEVVKVSFSDGKELICTPNHPIHTNRGFVPVDALRYGDIISQWKQSYSMKFIIIGMVSITRLLVAVLKGGNDFMFLFGNIITGKYLPAFIFTTGITLDQTIESKTYNYSQQKTISGIMQQKMRKILSLLPVEKLISIKSTQLPQCGMGQKKELLGTSNMVKICGKISRNIQKTAFNVENLIPRIFQKFQSSVITIVKLEHYGNEDVYNLEVEGSHTFYANNILVHNCDALRYPLMMDSPFSSRRMADLTYPNQKHYGGDEYADITGIDNGYIAHRYE